MSHAELNSNTSRYALYYVYLAILEFVCVYISTVGFYWSGERIVRRLRREYLEAIVRQNMSFFDTISIGQLTTHITSDMTEIQEALTSKLSLALTAVANFLSAFIIAFVMSPLLALILCSVLVVMVIVTSITTRFAVKNNKISKDLYSVGSSIAQEAIANIRHVAAYNSQHQLADKYEAFLCGAEKSGIRSRYYLALAFGWSNAMPCFAYALGFYAGAMFLARGQASISGIVTTTTVIVNGAFAMVRVIPLLEGFVSSISSVNATFKIIERQSPMDPFVDDGRVPTSVNGDIELQDVEMIYPSQRQIKTLKGVSISIEANKTTALVGLSGCGKSTILGLLERFYEPTAGSVRLDGLELKDLNLRWLRSQMAYVGQEPVLFSTTIFENIRHGLINSRLPLETPEETKERVIAASKMAYADDFVMALPNGYDTEIGEKGLSLSGGQRQRIAIARAIISDPKILLLDEATSALDTRSEKIIQQALDNAAKNRTTIIVAHRLSTICNADKIIVMEAGKVVEQGTHSDLLSQNGLYADLVDKQQVLNAIAHSEKLGDKTVWHAQSMSTLGARSHGGSSNVDEKGSRTIRNMQSVATLDVVSDTGDSNIGDMEKLHNSLLNKQSVATLAVKSDYENPNVDEKAHEAPRAIVATDNQPVITKEANPSVWLALRIILHLNQAERVFLVGGLITSALGGVSLIIPALWYAHTLSVFSLTNMQDLVSGTNFWALIFTMTGIYAFFVSLFNGIFFAISTERLARRVRDTTLRSILRQNIGYFDDKAHDLGRMASKLSSSATDLTGLSGAVIGSIITFTSTIFIAVVMCTVIGWKLSLVCIAVIPLLAGLGWVRLKVIVVFNSKIRLAGERAAAYASEVAGAIRTVASAGLENYVLDVYQDIQVEQASKSLVPILRTSALYAASQAINFLASALVFWYGSGLLASGGYNLVQYYTCLIGLIWGGACAGALFNFAPDMGKSAHAAYDLKQLFDRTPEIDSWNQLGAKVAREACEGHLRFEGVSFIYPSRPDTIVLRDLTLDIPAGKFVALVGSSGSGKSTILGLLERFYNPTGGRITLDGHDIKDLNLNSYRQTMSLVSQEPAVYSGTIRENLLVGQDPVNPPTEEQIVASCRDANIYGFISSLPDGFETDIGSQGSMLSGGQRQRLTIARALLRASPILILDEATAALDSDSEKLVQEALNATSQGRTTVAIAHRLSTIQHADIIYVLDEGRLVEQGSHVELLKMQGAYYDLVQSQGL